MSQGLSFLTCQIGINTLDLTPSRGGLNEMGMHRKCCYLMLSKVKASYLGAGHSLASTDPSSLKGGEHLPAGGCGNLDQWLASCRGFSACAVSVSSLNLSPRPEVRRCVDFSSRGPLQSMLSSLVLLAITSPCSVEQKREPGHTSHWFLCFLFVTHFCEYFK